MAVNLGEIFMRLSVIGGGAARRELHATGQSVAAFDRQAQQAGPGVAGISSNLMQMGFTAQAAAYTMVQLGTATAAFSGVMQAGRIQEAQIGFETLFDSADKARAVIHEMQEFAAKTAFDTTGAIEMAKFMAAMGSKAEELPTHLRAVADAVAATGGNNEILRRVIINLSQVAGMARVDARTLREFAFAGIPIERILAAGLGKTVEQMGDLDKLMDKMSGKEFFQLFVKGVQTSTFAGAAERLGGTFFGRLRNTMDELSRVMEPTGALIIAPLTLVLGVVVNTIGAVGRLNRALGGGVGLAAVLMLLARYGGLALGIVNGVIVAIRGLVMALTEMSVAAKAAAAATRLQAASTALVPFAAAGGIGAGAAVAGGLTFAGALAWLKGGVGAILKFAKSGFGLGAIVLLASSILQSVLPGAIGTIVGNVGMFAGLGAMLGGTPGAIGGGIVGLGLGIWEAMSDKQTKIAENTARTAEETAQLRAEISGKAYGGGKRTASAVSEMERVLTMTLTPDFMG